MSPISQISPVTTTLDTVPTQGGILHHPAVWRIALATAGLIGAAVLSACEPQSRDSSAETSPYADSSARRVPTVTPVPAVTPARAEPTEPSEFQTLQNCLNATHSDTYNKTIGDAEDSTIIAPYSVVVGQKSKGGFGCNTTPEKYWNFLKAHVDSPEDAALVASNKGGLVLDKDLGTLIPASSAVSIERGFGDCNEKAIIACAGIDAYAKNANRTEEIATKILVVKPEQSTEKGHTICSYTDKNGRYIVEKGQVTPYVGSLEGTFHPKGAARYETARLMDGGAVYESIGPDLEPTRERFVVITTSQPPTPESATPSHVRGTVQEFLPQDWANYDPTALRVLFVTDSNATTYTEQFWYTKEGGFRVNYESGTNS
ncbi:MAG: hypothetical protein WC846_03550 [Candidatus Gracilibacteria bacterium]|jgi:hypothetical protein